jgi:hypothetical protein
MTIIISRIAGIGLREMEDPAFVQILSLEISHRANKGLPKSNSCQKRLAKITRSNKSLEHRTT